MSLPHAILGLLTVMPMTGYDLKTQAFDRTIAHFWHADQAQIYRTLSAMEQQGWVECTLEVQQDRPNRKVYRITETGRTELIRWLATPQPLPHEREPFLVQLFFASELEPAVVLQQIAHQRSQHQARLAAYQQIPLPPLDDLADDPRRIFWRLTLELGIAHEQAYLTWLDQCEAVVCRMIDEAKRC